MACLLTAELVPEQYSCFSAVTGDCVVQLSCCKRLGKLVHYNAVAPVSWETTFAPSHGCTCVSLLQQSHVMFSNASTLSSAGGQALWHAHQSSHCCVAFCATRLNCTLCLPHSMQTFLQTKCHCSGHSGCPDWCAPKHSCYCESACCHAPPCSAAPQQHQPDEPPIKPLN